VLLDTDGSGNLLYLPLDQLLNRSGIQMPALDANRASDSPTPQSQTDSMQDPRSTRKRRVRE
jgi:hypothetical protein